MIENSETLKCFGYQLIKLIGHYVGINSRFASAKNKLEKILGVKFKSGRAAKTD